NASLIYQETWRGARFVSASEIESWEQDKIAKGTHVCICQIKGSAFIDEDKLATLVAIGFDREFSALALNVEYT
ncbi:hypothetical protein PENTCL1PPCAC_9702, partial [Pristionchus entomophagus]